MLTSQRPVSARHFAPRQERARAYLLCHLPCFELVYFTLPVASSNTGVTKPYMLQPDIKSQRRGRATYTRPPTSWYIRMHCLYNGSRQDWLLRFSTSWTPGSLNRHKRKWLLFSVIMCDVVQKTNKQKTCGHTSNIKSVIIVNN